MVESGHWRPRRGLPIANMRCYELSDDSKRAKMEAVRSHRCRTVIVAQKKQGLHPVTLRRRGLRSLRSFRSRRVEGRGGRGGGLKV